MSEHEGVRYDHSIAWTARRLRVRAALIAIGAVSSIAPAIGAPTQPVARASCPVQMQGSISGRVQYQDRAVTGVQVLLRSNARSFRTDERGRFRLDSVCAGLDTIVAQHIGFAPVRDTIRVIAGAEMHRDIRLGPRLVELDTVRSLAASNDPLLRDFERRRTTAIGGHFITDSVLRANENVSLPSLLRTRIPGLRFVPVPGGEALASSRNAFDGALKSRSSQCYPAVYLDGALYYEGSPRPPPPLTSIPVLNLSGIEYYSGPATIPLEFKSVLNACGVLVLWRRVP